ncbi:hypothetical protein B0T10DRAFT_418339 [Thelonectria olida]|uniref:Uncharacterized protein n=1 Tax=Thelonectria olida TaxID=1576542 RepID=A0A9P8VQI6_9HYPO|nr:hypothetical protein B0T10DRAFT_418339 [Thelonectria olida]
MNPKTYTTLLFDDETFSRSRLYFWILGCLNEFNISIEDNIKQWKLFRQARISRVLDPSSKSSSESSPKSPSSTFDKSHDYTKLQELDKRAGEILRSLEDLQAQFQAKMATVQALRDGLFNASALMESRSSTRLGQNVQLLTYVSIFYLPLGFCAALWAIPNITDGATRIPFILAAFVVGFVTYAVVFNLGNIAGILGKLYSGYRARLLRQMEEDGIPSWQERRKQFEEFPPNQEQKIPSEWWIFAYQMRRLFRAKKPASATGSGATRV